MNTRHVLAVVRGVCVGTAKTGRHINAHVAAYCCTMETRSSRHGAPTHGTILLQCLDGSTRKLLVRLSDQVYQTAAQRLQHASTEVSLSDYTRAVQWSVRGARTNLLKLARVLCWTAAWHAEPTLLSGRTLVLGETLCVWTRAYPDFDARLLRVGAPRVYRLEPGCAHHIPTPALHAWLLAGNVVCPVCADWIDATHRARVLRHHNTGAVTRHDWRAWLQL